MNIWKKIQSRIKNNKPKICKQEESFPYPKLFPRTYLNGRNRMESSSDEIPLLTHVFKSDLAEKIKFASLIFNGKYLLFIVENYNMTEYRLLVCSEMLLREKTDYLDRSSYVSFHTIFSLNLNMVIKHVMLADNNRSLIICGCYKDKKMTLMRYHLDYSNNDVSVRYVEQSFLPGYHFTMTNTVFTAIQCENNMLAFVLMDFSRHPQPLILYIFELTPKLNLQKFVDLRSAYPALRGIVSSLLFINQCKQLLLVSTCFQLFSLTLSCDVSVDQSDICLKNRPVFLEDDEELIQLDKLVYYSVDDLCITEDKEFVYALSQSFVLYYISDLKASTSNEIPITSIDLNNKVKGEGIRVSWFSICKFTTRMFILTQVGFIFVYDLRQQTFLLQLDVSQFRRSPHLDWQVFLNWYGDEIYFVQHDILYLFSIQDQNTSLKNLCRLKLLENLSFEQILHSGLPQKLVSYIFSKY